MKIDRVLELLKIERECVTRQSPCNEKSKLCDRNCGECDIAQNDLELIEMYDFVISMIETLIGRSQWISVEDKLPGKCTNYLVYFGKGIGTTMKTAVWLPEKRIWKGAEAYITLNGITHWMPTPRPPEEVKQDG